MPLRGHQSFLSNAILQPPHESTLTALHSHGCNNKNKNVNNGENYAGLTNTMKKKKMCIPDMWISTLVAAFLTMAPMQHVVSMPAFALDSISSPYCLCCVGSGHGQIMHRSRRTLATNSKLNTSGHWMPL